MLSVISGKVWLYVRMNVKDAVTKAVTAFSFRGSFFVGVACTVGECPVAVSTGGILGLDGFLGGFGVETVFVGLHIVGVAAVSVGIPGQRNVLLAGQYVLYFGDIQRMGAAAVHDGYRGSHTGGLAGTYALGDQIHIVYGHPVSGDVTARSQKILHLLGQNGTVGDLDGGIVVERVHSAVPGNAIVVLLGEGPVVGGDDVLAHYTVRAAGAQLRCDVVEIGVVEYLGAIFAVILHHFPQLDAGAHLGGGLIGDLGAVTPGLPVIHPAHIVSWPGDHGGAEAVDVRQTLSQRPGGVTVLGSPLVEGFFAESADAVDQRRGGAAALVVDSRGGGSAGEPAEVGIAGGVDDHLGQHGLAPFLGIEDDALADIAFHDGIGAPAVVEDSDAVAKLIEHHVHLDLELVGLHHKGVDDAGICAAGGTTGIGPIFHHFGVGAAGQIV